MKKRIFALTLGALFLMLPSLGFATTPSQANERFEMAIEDSSGMFWTDVFTVRFEYDINTPSEVLYSSECPGHQDFEVGLEYAVEFSNLGEGVYAGCRITLESDDTSEQTTFTVPTFTVDRTAPALNNVTATWDEPNRQVKYQFKFSEKVSGKTISPIELNGFNDTTETGFTSPVKTKTINFDIAVGESGKVTIKNSDFTIKDIAGNTTLITAAMINALTLGKEVTIIENGIDTVLVSIRPTPVYFAGTDASFGVAVDYPEDIDQVDVKYDVDARLSSSPSLPLGAKIALQYQGVDVSSTVLTEGRNSILLSELTGHRAKLNAEKDATWSIILSNLSGADYILSFESIALDSSNEDAEVILGTADVEFFVDTAPPTYSSVTASIYAESSSNPVSNRTIASVGDEVVIALNLAKEVSRLAGAGSISIKVGDGSIQGLSINEAGPASSYSATYVVKAGDNGVIKVTGINFKDADEQDITGVPEAGVSTTLEVDTTAPILDSVTLTTSGTTWATRAGWARTNQEIVYNLVYSAAVQSAAITQTEASNASIFVNDAENTATYETTENIIFQVANGDNGVIAISDANIVLTDEAGNFTTLNAATINNLVSGVITADTTKPTASSISITSNNSLDTALAKTNDTITVAMETADNFAASGIRLGTVYSTIFDETVTNNVSGNQGAVSMSLLTDGDEPTETVVPFKFRIWDDAGNYADYNQEDTSSSVKYDATNPVIQNVSISAESQDDSAYMGDMPTYYARQGDSITLTFEGTDWVDLLDGMTGTILGMPATFHKMAESCDGTAGWCEWSATVENIDGEEGNVAVQIIAQDNAGNGNDEIYIGGTTDGSSVTFDKTAPTNPTDTLDLAGAETTSLKPLTEMSYSWSDDSDNLAGIWKYLLQVTNNGDRFHTDSVVDMTGELSTKSFSATNPQLKPTSLDEPYSLEMVAIDKAGNSSENSAIYTQSYAAYLHGTVTSAEGKVLPNTIVQVVARYGEFCDFEKEVCSTKTDENGQYSLLVNPEQDYNVTFFAGGYYLNKKDRRVASADFQLDPVMVSLTSIHDIQTNSQVVRLVLGGATFEIHTNSGQITTRQDGAATFVTSLSTITKIQQIAPTKGDFLTCSAEPVELGELIISCEGNEWMIEGAGGLISNNGGGIDYDANTDSRIGIAYNPANGSPAGFSGRVLGSGTPAGGFYSQADVRNSLAALDAGVKPAIINYVNSNGYPVFAGYRAGRLAMSHYAQPALNMVRIGGRVKVAAGESLVDKLHEMKLLAGAIRPEAESFHAKVSRFGPLVRRASGDGVASVLARKRHQARQVNKFARYNPLKNQRESKLQAKDYGSVAMTIGGKRISMNQMFGLGDGSTLQLVQDEMPVLRASTE